MNADIQRAASGMQTVAVLQSPTMVDEFYDQRTQRMGSVLSDPLPFSCSSHEVCFTTLTPSTLSRQEVRGA
jgi:hypothetical protein